jgi:hypothetical protein
MKIISKLTAISALFAISISLVGCSPTQSDESACKDYYQWFTNQPLPKEKLDTNGNTDVEAIRYNYATSAEHYFKNADALDKLSSNAKSSELISESKDYANFLRENAEIYKKFSEIWSVSNIPEVTALSKTITFTPTKVSVFYQTIDALCASAK